MLKKLFTSSFLPFWFFHIPIFPYFLFLSLKRKSLSFFTNVNPNIYTGGFVSSSKVDAFKGIAQNYIPKFILLSENKLDKIEKELNNQKIKYPFILKPNKGERGIGVIKVNNRDELINKLNNITSDIIIQEFIDHPLEFGILYYKHPKTGEDGISSITKKEFPFVLGDGKSSLKTLVTNKYKNSNFENINCQNLNQVLNKAEHFALEYIAHRNKKCVFKNFNFLNSKKLVETFRNITSNMDSFHFGRFDVKVKSIEDLIDDNNIKILEVNGVNSQPIHIFDPSYSTYKCYKDLHEHWRLIYKISKQNVTKGYQPIKTKYLIREIVNKYKNEKD
jgi:D-alanine-D-alanine ligase-like ATP-grasp enzyme|tara:strand:- start:1611 stop:2609 length:999 start_codon:yes stop_codon:yes gene_type:complete